MEKEIPFKSREEIPFKSRETIQNVKIALSIPLMLNSVLELQNDLAVPSNVFNIPSCNVHNQETISAVIHSHFQGDAFSMGFLSYSLSQLKEILLVSQINHTLDFY